MEVMETGILCGEYPRQWFLLMDKGYKGAAEIVCEVVPKK